MTTTKHVFDPFDDVRLHEAAEKGLVLLPLAHLAHTAREAREMAQHEAERAVANQDRAKRMSHREIVALMGVRDHQSNRRSMLG
jgi:hypothetical protein